MHPLALLAQRFAHRAGERHDVMACLLFDLFDAIDIECGVLPKFVDIL